MNEPHGVKVDVPATDGLDQVGLRAPHTALEDAGAWARRPR